jgi:hypothetical protein
LESDFGYLAFDDFDAVDVEEAVDFGGVDFKVSKGDATIQKLEFDVF